MEKAGEFLNFVSEFNLYFDAKELQVLNYACLPVSFAM